MSKRKGSKVANPPVVEANAAGADIGATQISWRSLRTGMPNPFDVSIRSRRIWRDWPTAAPGGACEFVQSKTAKDFTFK